MKPFSHCGKGFFLKETASKVSRFCERSEATSSYDLQTNQEITSLCSR